MNKLKRLYLPLLSKCLRLIKFLSNETYRKVLTYYFRELSVVFHGKPKYINYDVDFDLTVPGLIHVGKNTVIAKQTTILTHDYSIECGLTAIGKTEQDYEMQFLKEVHIGNNCFIGYKYVLYFLAQKLEIIVLLNQEVLCQVKSLITQLLVGIPPKLYAKLQIGLRKKLLSINM